MFQLLITVGHYRRLGVTIDPEQVILMNGCTKKGKKSIFKEQEAEKETAAASETSVNVVELEAPITEEQIRS